MRWLDVVPKSWLSRTATGFLLIAVLPLSSAVPRSGVPRSGVPLPALVLWAWERPEDLRFLEPERHGVAFLAGTVELAGDVVRARGRRQPLAVAPATALVAVVRIESSRRDPPALSPAQRLRVADAVLHWATVDDVLGVQVDFDASVSERSWYRDLLSDLRRRLPAGRSLTITALASWCLGDPWLAGLPVDDAVPMLFRMGADAPAVHRALAAGRDFRNGLCRQSFGVSSDETMPRLRRNRRLYVFHPESWTPVAFRRVVRDIEESLP